MTASTEVTQQPLVMPDYDGRDFVFRAALRVGTSKDSIAAEGQ